MLEEVLGVTERADTRNCPRKADNRDERCERENETGFRVNGKR